MADHDLESMMRFAVAWLYEALCKMAYTTSRGIVGYTATISPPHKGYISQLTHLKDSDMLRTAKLRPLQLTRLTHQAAM